jgi:8-amino-7-oxononanoate synthase
VPEPAQRRIARRMENDLERLREKSQLRTLETMSGVNLCSNDYLGLATDPKLKEAVTAAVSRAALMGSTGSRLLSGNGREWQELESDFAGFTGSEAALYFGSGYAANVGLLSCILRPGDVVFSDALNHASLIDGIRLSGAAKIIYPHRDLAFLEQALREQRNAPGTKVIVTESIFSMEGDVAPIRELVRLAREYGAELVVDEAHAIGVCGPGGRGIVAEQGCEKDVLAVVCTCGKALASAGAFVGGGRVLIEYLINHARTFVYSTAMPPYLAGQIRAAVDLAREAEGKRAHLQKIAAALRDALSDARIDFGASTTHIVPVFLGSNQMALHVAAELDANGFAARAIRPPTVPEGTARIRISLTSKISLEEVRQIAAAIEAARRSFPLAAFTSTMHA